MLRLARELRALGARTVEEVEVGGARLRLRALRRRCAAPAAERARRHGARQQRLQLAPPSARAPRATGCMGSARPTPRGRSRRFWRRWRRGRCGGPSGVLFSGDEEHGGSCIRAFLASPAGARDRARHRLRADAAAGSASATAASAPRRRRCRRPGGHSSLVDGIVNPIAVLARAARRAGRDGGRAPGGRGRAGFQGICLNVAALDGGIAFNVIPTRATLSFSLRPAPGAERRDPAGRGRAAGARRGGAAPRPI